MYSVLVILTIILNVAFTAPTKSCRDGIQEGESVDKGRYWYTCQEGKLLMKGCLSDKKSRLGPRETYKAHGFIIECVPDPNGDYSFAYKGCVTESDQEIMPNESWQDNNYWYTCKTVGDQQVAAEISGCVDNGRRYNPGQCVPKADLIYACKRHDDGHVGWNISPNANEVPYVPEDDHVQKQQSIQRHFAI